MRVYVAGTFNRFHAGHAALLDEAVRLAEDALRWSPSAELTVMVTSDAMAQASRDVPVRPFGQRLADVMAHLKGCTVPVRVMSMDGPDMTDPLAECGDIIVCSEETAPRARALAGTSMRVAVVPMVRDADGEIHATRIVRREQEEGRIPEYDHDALSMEDAR